MSQAAHPAPLGSSLAGGGAVGSWRSPNGTYWLTTALTAHSGYGMSPIQPAPLRSASLPPHAGGIDSVTLAPTAHLASGSLDGDMRLWTLPTVLTSSTPGLDSVAFGPTGIHWPAAATAVPFSCGMLLIRAFRGHSPTWPTVPAGLTSVAFSPNGHTLASSSYSSAIQLWDVADPRIRGRSPILVGSEVSAYSVAFSPDGRTLASGNSDGTVRLWDLRRSRRPRPVGPVIPSSTTDVLAVAFSPERRLAGQQRLDKAPIRLWDVADAADPRPA